MLKNPLGILSPRMSTYKRDSDKTKCMYFLIKDFLINLAKFGKKLAILSTTTTTTTTTKKNRKLIYKKLYLKFEKKQQKRRLSLHM